MPSSRPGAALGSGGVGDIADPWGCGTGWGLMGLEFDGDPSSPLLDVPPCHLYRCWEGMSQKMGGGQESLQAGPSLGVSM